MAEHGGGRRFTQVIDVSLQIQGLVKVDAQYGDCIREIYNRACDIDGCYTWTCGEHISTTEQAGQLLAVPYTAALPAVGGANTRPPPATSKKPT